MRGWGKREKAGWAQSCSEPGRGREGSRLPVSSFPFLASPSATAHPATHEANHQVPSGFLPESRCVSPTQSHGPIGTEPSRHLPHWRDPNRHPPAPGAHLSSQSLHFTCKGTSCWNRTWLMSDRCPDGFAKTPNRPGPRNKLTSSPGSDRV